LLKDRCEDHVAFVCVVVACPPHRTHTLFTTAVAPKWFV
jgi:hypothetical protein